MDGGSEVDDRAAGGHHRVGDLVGLGSAAAVPPVAPGHDARRAVLGAEVDEGEDGRDLDVGVRAREVRPHVFVAVGDLRLRAGPADDEVPEVQPVARALREEDLVAGGEIRRVGHHLVGERR